MLSSLLEVFKQNRVLARVQFHREQNKPPTAWLKRAAPEVWVTQVPEHPRPTWNIHRRTLQLGTACLLAIAGNPQLRDGP